MDIDPQIAETIVTNIKGVIQHEINLFNTHGLIIASTDRSRIGTAHDGARLAVRTKQNVVIDDEHQFEGARNGINVPVLFNDSVVAVIGITGVREEVEPFGNVIKKMTEILIRENLEQITRFDQRMMMSNLVSMLTMRRHDAAITAYLASVMNIDLSRPRRALVGRPCNEDSILASQDGWHTIISAHLRPMGESLFTVNATGCCILLDEPDQSVISAFLHELSDDIESSTKTPVCFGAGTIASNADEYWRSYDEAGKTVDWQMFTGLNDVEYYENLDFGLLISSLDHENAYRFVERIFSGLNDDDLDIFQTAFNAYAKHNGSIIHAADELFLHKNTLQNRLNKIARETGYNPRILKEYTILDTAFKLRDYLRFKSQQTIRHQA